MSSGSERISVMPSDLPFKNLATSTPSAKNNDESISDEISSESDNDEG